MRFLPLILSLIATPVVAEAFDRPIPQAQTAEAEFWYLVASVAFVAALVGIQWLVRRS